MCELDGSPFKPEDEDMTHNPGVPENTREIRKAYAKGRKDAIQEIRDPPYRTENNYEVVQAYWEGHHAATDRMTVTRVKRIPR